MVEIKYRVSFKYYEYCSKSTSHGTYYLYRDFKSIDKARQYRKLLILSNDSYQGEYFNTFTCNWGYTQIQDLGGFGFLESEYPTIELIKTQKIKINEYN